MVNIWGTTMVKDEVDIIESTIHHIFQQGVEGVVIADNLSTDGTYEKLLELQSTYPTLEVIQDSEVGYYQSDKMTGLGRIAATMHGADWILPFDADELWYSNGELLSDLFERADGDVMYGIVWHMVATHDLAGIDPVKTMVYRRGNPEQFPVVAYRFYDAAVVHMGNHGVSSPGVLSSNHFEVKHYQYRSLKQYKSKIRNGKVAVDATNFDFGICQHWREDGILSDDALAEKWNQMMNEEGLVYDPWLK